MIEISARSLTYGTIAAIFTAIANRYLGGWLEPVSVLMLVSGGYLLGAVEGEG